MSDAFTCATLLQRLQEASRVITAAQDESTIGQALMSFAASSQVDSARLIVFTDLSDDRPAAVELREGWVADDRPIPDYGSRLPLTDQTWLVSLEAQEVFVCQDLAAEGEGVEATCRWLALSGAGSLMVVPLIARRNGQAESSQAWLGALLIGRDSPSEYAEELLYAWWTLADQAASALEDLRFLAEGARHRLLLESIQTPVLALRDDMTILYCNEAYAHFTHHAVLELVGKDLLAMFPWMQESKTYAAYTRALETGEPQEAEGQFGDRYLLARVYRTPWGIVAVLEDMTERKRMIADLENRTLRLQTAAEVSRAASSILDPDELIQRVVDLARERFDLYYAGLFLVDRTGEWTGEPNRWAVLRAGTGKAGQQMIAAGHKLEIGGESMIGWCVANSQARIALDVGEEAVRFENPVLPETRSEMALPLISRGQAIGAMTIQSTEPDAFDERDIAILQTMADQLANVIENARLFRERERRAAEQTIVNEIGQALSTALELDELLQVVYRQISRVFDTTNFYIALYREGSADWFSALQYERGERQPPAWHSISAGLTGYIIRNRRLLLLDSVEENRAFHEQQGTETLGEPAKSWLGVPLIAADKVVGVMGVQSYRLENLYHQQRVTLFSTIADRVASAIENARLYEEVSHRAERLAVVNRIGAAVSAVLDPDELVETVYREIAAIFEPDAMFIALYEEDVKELNFVLRVEKGNRLPVDRYPLGEGLTTLVVLNKEPLLIRNFEEEKDRLPPARLWGTEAPPSWLGVPMRIGERILGVISVQAYRLYAYGEEEQLLLATIADQVAAALETQQLYAQELQRREQAEAVARVGQVLVSTLDLESALPQIMGQIAQVMQVPQCGVILLDQAAGVGHLVAEYRQESGTSSEPVQVPIAGNPSLERIIETRQPLNILNAETDPLMAAIRDVIGARGIKSILIVPMLVGGRIIGTIGFDSLDQRRHFTDEEIRLAMMIAGQLAAAIENSRLLVEQQQATSLMGERVKALDCLNDIGRKIDETPPIPEFLKWLTERIPSAMGYPEACLAAVQFNGQVYGAAGALDLPRQMTGGLRAGGEWVGRVYVAYTEEREFVDEDSALLGDIVRRVSGYVENRHLFEQTQQLLEETRRRAQREQVLRQITARVRGSTNPDIIVRVAVRELGVALGRSTFVRLGSAEQLQTVNSEGEESHA